MCRGRGSVILLATRLWRRPTVVLPPRGREVRSMRSSSPAPPAPATGTAPPSPGSSPRSPITRWLRFLVFPALLLINFVVIQQMTPAQPQRVEVSYTFFKQQVEADNV